MKQPAREGAPLHVPPYPQGTYSLPFLVSKQNDPPSLSFTPSSSQGALSRTRMQIQPEKGPLQPQPSNSVARSAPG